MRGRGSGGAVLGQAGFCQGKHEAQEEDAFHAGKFNREGATAQRILGVGRILATDETRMGNWFLTGKAGIAGEAAEY